MNYLLDTHSFLWGLLSPGKLSAGARNTIEDGGNVIAVSAISFWEISIKWAIGKLELEGLQPEQLPGLARSMNLALWPLEAEEAAAQHLFSKREHRDPFDRMLAWQSIQRGAVLITNDTELRAYRFAGLRVLW